jgi:hypothetical protein
MRSESDVRQDAVLFIAEGENTRIFLHVNETEETDPEEGNVFFSYDFHEFVAPTDKLDLDDIKENPEKYLDFEYHEETLEERVAKTAQTVTVNEGEIALISADLSSAQATIDSQKEISTSQDAAIAEVLEISLANSEALAAAINSINDVLDRFTAVLGGKE